jgi:hypothetical protein
LAWGGTIATSSLLFLLLNALLQSNVLLALLLTLMCSILVYNLWNYLASYVDFYLPFVIPVPSEYRVLRLLEGMRGRSYVFLVHFIDPKLLLAITKTWSEKPEGTFEREAYSLVHWCWDTHTGKLDSERYQLAKPRIERLSESIRELYGLR